MNATSPPIVISWDFGSKISHFAEILVKKSEISTNYLITIKLLMFNNTYEL